MNKKFYSYIILTDSLVPILAQISLYCCLSHYNQIQPHINYHIKINNFYVHIISTDIFLPILDQHYIVVLIIRISKYMLCYSPSLHSSLAVDVYQKCKCKLEDKQIYRPSNLHMVECCVARRMNILRTHDKIRNEKLF